MADAGLLEGLVAEGELVPELFVAAMRRGDPIGVCACGGWMYGSVDRTRRITFYSGECGSCGKGWTSPNGRLASTPRPEPERKPRRSRRPVPKSTAEAWAARDRAMLGERDED